MYRFVVVGLVAIGLASFAGSLLSSPQQDGAPAPKKGGKKNGGKGGAKKVELAHPFYWAEPDPVRGDWQGPGGYVAQVIRAGDKVLSVADLIPQQSDNGKYQANIFRKFDQPNDKPVVILEGEVSGDTINFTGDGWTGTIAGGHFKASKETESFDLQHITRTPPSLGAKPPAGAIVLFDGTNMDGWAKMKEKDWLTEDGPSGWLLIPGGAMESVPRSGSLISHKSFGDVKIHVEFRNPGGPSNSGVYLQDRYEANTNEVYGKLEGNPCANFDNCTPASAKPGIRCSRPPLEWQTLDIDFKAPRFDAAGERTAPARATLYFNGTLLYNDQELGPVTLNAARLGEAPTGPIQLQEHGMPVQFRNIWALETGPVQPALPPKRASNKKPTDDTSNPAYAATSVVLTPDPSSKPAKSAGFTHPGVLLNRAQLDEIKKRVAAGKDPQKTAFEALRSNKLGALDYTPHPRATVECGSYSNPDLGCKDEQNDSDASYAQALLWYITGNTVYAENAIKIMDAWSSTLTGGHTNNNGQVQASWAGDVWPRTAEIIRYAYGKWPDASIARFQNMLTTQYLPSLIHGTCENGNKELTISEALVNIGVFNDNRAAYDLGIKMWRGRAPAYIYLKSDGPKPVEPPGCGTALWGNKGFTPELVDGLLQETARDSQHANLAFSALVDVAETARQQGLDLYAEQGKRIMAAMEFQAQYLPPNSTPAPPSLEFNLHPTWEIAYNHFHDRIGMSLPKMAVVIPTNRPTGVNHHMNWETLTHAQMGSIGLPPVRLAK